MHQPHPRYKRRAPLPVRLKLLQMDISQRQLAKRIGISTSYLNQILTGERRPATILERLRRIGVMEAAA